MNIRKHYEDYSRDIQLVYNSQATIKNYKSQVLCFLNYFKDEVEPKSISNDKIKNWLLEAQTINSRKHRLCALNSFYKITIGMPSKIQKIPYPKSEKKLPIVLSQDEVQKMFDVCENTKHKVILALLYSTGIRVSELINLKWEHLDRSRGIINIIGGKGNKDRQVMLSNDLHPLLEKYWKEYKPFPYVLKGQFSEQYSDRSVGQVMKQLAVKARINKRVYTHLMRHNCFTHLVENGIDINLIQKLAGHSNVKTTLVYTHISHNIISNIQSPLSQIKLNK
jgi:site-specific recombinase XerD